MSNIAATVLTIVVVVLTGLYMLGHNGHDLQRAICPQPVTAGGRTISCDGSATVTMPDGRTAVITPPAVARKP